MAFGGRQFWRQPGNLRDSNKYRFRSAHASSSPTTGVDQPNHSERHRRYFTQVRPLATPLVARLYRRMLYRRTCGVLEFLAFQDRH